MAEINIRRKRKRKPMWPWALGLALLLGMIWVIAEITEDPVTRELGAEKPYPLVTDTVSDRGAERERNAFVSFVKDNDVQDQLGVSRVVTAEALMRLSHTIEELAGSGQQYRQQVDEIRTSAEQMQAEPNPTAQRQANLVNNAFNSAANALEKLQQTSFPGAETEVRDVREQLASIDPVEPLQDQHEEVQGFFKKAADAVEQMQGRSGEGISTRRETRMDDQIGN